MQDVARRTTSHAKDITGQHFGLLTAIAPEGKDNTGNVKWRCKCDCGNFTVVTACNLKSGGTMSCGQCIRKESNYEIKIRQWLQNNGFSFSQECKVKELGLLRFDFKVLLQNGNYAFIEMQGQQHFTPISKFGGEARFKIQQEHDALKENYCKTNHIPFLQIRFDEKIEDKLKTFFDLLTFND